MQVSIRRESDAQLISDVNNGEALIKALGERNIAIERSLTDVKTINEGYSQLLKALKKNAPFRESHVKSLEIGEKFDIFLSSHDSYFQYFRAGFP